MPGTARGRRCENVDGQRSSTAIWAVPFSLKTLEVTGKPFPIAQHGASPAVSLTGTIVYSDVPSGRCQLVMLDRAGRTLSAIGDPEPQNGPSLSPDGRYVAVTLGENDQAIWVYDLARGMKTRVNAG